MSANGTMAPIPGTSPRLEARIAGALYLIVIVTGIFAEVLVRGRLVVDGDAAATARNIVTHELLYRLGFAAEIVACVCNMPIALIFYDLFKVASRSAAILVVFFTLVGSAIECSSLLYHYAPLVLLKSGPALAALGAGERQALTYASLQLAERGFATGLVFFGFYCLSLWYAILRSTFFPRVIGVLLAIEGLAYLADSFASFIAPPVAARIFPFLAVSAVAEISLCLWLLVVGVNAERWSAQAAAGRRS